MADNILVFTFWFSDFELVWAPNKFYVFFDFLFFCFLFLFFYTRQLHAVVNDLLKNKKNKKHKKTNENMQINECSYSVFNSKCLMLSASHLHMRPFAECYKCATPSIYLLVQCGANIKNKYVFR